MPLPFLRIAAANQVAPLANIAGHCSDKETFVGNISLLDVQYFHAKRNHLLGLIEVPCVAVERHLDSKVVVEKLVALFPLHHLSACHDQGLRFYQLHKLVGSVEEEVWELDDLKAVGLIELDNDVLTPFLHNLSTLTKLKMEVVALQDKDDLIDSWFAVETDLVQNLSNWTNMSKLVIATLAVLSLLHQLSLCYD